jgi:dihydropteroate synthase
MLRLGPVKLESPAVMGVLNVTPDSFSDGGRYSTIDVALRRAEQMADQGAAIIDVGGESTRPGASAVSEQEELDRVLPVIEAVRRVMDHPISIDTSKPGVMREAVAAGASIINDVYALQAEGALQAAVELQQPVCLMHMQGEPRTMQNQPQYDDVVAEVTQFLRERVAQCVEAGLDRELIIVDPGFGFGKSPAHNVALLAGLSQVTEIGVPVLVGLSRKSTLGKITGKDISQLMPASIVAAVLAFQQGAQIIRAHDIAETVDALRVAAAVMNSGSS